MRVKRYRVGELGFDLFPSTYPAIILLGVHTYSKTLKRQSNNRHRSCNCVFLGYYGKVATRSYGWKLLGQLITV